MTTSAGNEAGAALPTCCTEALLLDLFAAAVAARNGERIAIEAPDVRLTYRELSERAAGFASALAPLAPEAMVAVLLPRHEPDLYAAQLGILMAGGAFACLDPKFPDGFLAQALRTAAAVVTDAEGGERLRGLEAGSGFGCRIVLAAEVASAAANIDWRGTPLGCAERPAYARPACSLRPSHPGTPSRPGPRLFPCRGRVAPPAADYPRPCAPALPAGQKARPPRAGERWDGVPAAHGGQTGEMPLPTRGRELGPNTHAGLLVGARLGQSLLAWLPWIAAALVAPGEASAGVAWWELHWNTAAGIGVAGLAAAVAVGMRLVVQAVAVRRMGRAQPGTIPTRSWEAARIEMAAEGLEAAGRWLAGTLLWPRWLRAAGMRVGRGCEISTILDVTPALVELGDECFLADGMYLAPPWRQQGRMVLARTRLGRDTFVGNHAVVPSGHDWPEGMFVGVATVPPDGAGSGKAWFGAPAMALPRKREAYDRRLTHEPNAARRAARWFWELARFALPSLPVALAIFWWSAMEAASATWGDAGLAFVVAPALLLAAAAAACAAAILVKWVLLGRVRPRMHAFWSCWCGRWD